MWRASKGISSTIFPDRAAASGRLAVDGDAAPVRSFPPTRESMASADNGNDLGSRVLGNDDWTMAGGVVASGAATARTRRSFPGHRRPGGRCKAHPPVQGSSADANIGRCTDRADLGRRACTAVPAAASIQDPDVRRRRQRPGFPRVRERRLDGRSLSATCVSATDARKARPCFLQFAARPARTRPSVSGGEAGRPARQRPAVRPTLAFGHRCRRYDGGRPRRP
jgi:hypothetical protein